MLVRASSTLSSPAASIVVSVHVSSILSVPSEINASKTRETSVRDHGIMNLVTLHILSSLAVAWAKSESERDECRY